MGISEGEIIALLQEIFPANHPNLVLGIGDDGAIFNGQPGQVITTDIAVEGNHFKVNWSPARKIGMRVVAANIADLMAMNATPQFLLLSVALTGSESIEWICELAEGIAEEAAKSGAVVIGGDTARSTTLTISITAIGQSENPIRRNGAQVGDAIYLSSLTGWSAAGLEIFTRDEKVKSHFGLRAISEYQSPVLDYSVDFSQATSMADVSDALITQGEQLARASQVAFEIDFDLIKASSEFAQLEELAHELGCDVKDWIASGGEDHVLLATGRDLPGLPIGKVISGSGISFKENGREIKMAPVAWDHFK